MSKCGNIRSHQLALFHSLFGDHPSNLALVDHDGYIRAVNKAWIDYGRQNGMSPEYDSIGVNYLELCSCRSSDHQQSDAARAAAGLLSVLHTGVSHFSMVYPCHSPSERRWYKLTVRSLSPEIEGVLISHTALSSGEGVVDEMLAEA